MRDVSYIRTTNQQPHIPQCMYYMDLWILYNSQQQYAQQHTPRLHHPHRASIHKHCRKYFPFNNALRVCAVSDLLALSRPRPIHIHPLSRRVGLRLWAARMLADTGILQTPWGEDVCRWSDETGGGWSESAINRVFCVYTPGVYVLNAWHTDRN